MIIILQIQTILIQTLPFQCKDLLQAQRIKTPLAPPLLCLPPRLVILLLIHFFSLWSSRDVESAIARSQIQILILTSRQRRGHRADIDDDGRPEVVQVFSYLSNFFSYLFKFYVNSSIVFYICLGCTSWSNGARACLSSRTSSSTTRWSSPCWSRSPSSQ